MTTFSRQVISLCGKSPFMFSRFLYRKISIDASPWFVSMLVYIPIASDVKIRRLCAGGSCRLVSSCNKVFESFRYPHKPLLYKYLDNCTPTSIEIILCSTKNYLPFLRKKNYIKLFFFSVYIFLYTGFLYIR